MKKTLYFLFALAIIIIPSKAFAISGSVNLNCTPASAFPGDSVTCTIAGDVSDGSIKDFAGTVTLSDNLEFTTTSVVSSWTGTSNGGIFSLTTETSQSDSFEIASFTVKVKDDSTTNGTITLKTTKLGDITDISDSTQTISMSSNVVDTAEGNQNVGSTLDTNTEVENPDTGSSIPFMIIGGGSILTIIIYELVAKKKKIYKI